MSCQKTPKWESILGSSLLVGRKPLLSRSWHELTWEPLCRGHQNTETLRLWFYCLLVSTVRPVEEHVEGTDWGRSLPGGRAGQLNRRGLDRAPRTTQHAAPRLRPGVHRSVRASTWLPCINSPPPSRLWRDEDSDSSEPVEQSSCGTLTVVL